MGDRTAVKKDTWVEPWYYFANGAVMNNVQWISVNDHDGTAYGVTQSVLILTNPAGGTISLVSGAAILTGNTVTFNHSAIVILRYTYMNIIGSVSCTTTEQISQIVRTGKLPLTLISFTARDTVCNPDLY